MTSVARRTPTCCSAAAARLGAEHDHVQVVGGDREACLAGRVEAPLQHVPLNEQRARYVALLGPLRGRPDVHQDRPVLAGSLRREGVEAEER